MRKHSHVYDSQNSKEFQHSVSVNSSKSDSSAPIFHECFSSVEQLSGPVSKLNEIIQDLIDYKVRFVGGTFSVGLMLDVQYILFGQYFKKCLICFSCF